MRKPRLTTIKGRHVAFTGHASRPRAQVVRDVLRRGGKANLRGALLATTDVLVRGQRSSHYSFGDFGTKEADVAQYIRQGKHVLVVDSDRFGAFLRSGRSVVAEDYVAGQQIEALRDEGYAREAVSRARKGGKPLAAAVKALVQDRKVTSFARAEQATLRASLLDGRERGKCCLCGRMYASSFLVAAHIKCPDYDSI